MHGYLSYFECLCTYLHPCFGCNFLCVCFQTLSASDLRDPVISGRIATRMKEFHGLDMPGVKKALLWDRLRYVSFVFLLLYLLYRLILGSLWIQKMAGCMQETGFT